MSRTRQFVFVVYFITYQLGVQLLDDNSYSEHMRQIPAHFVTSIENVYAVRSVVSSTDQKSEHIIHSKNMLTIELGFMRQCWLILLLLKAGNHGAIFMLRNVNCSLYDHLLANRAQSLAYIKSYECMDG